jgi:hypothetical protein
LVPQIVQRREIAQKRLRTTSPVLLLSGRTGSSKRISGPASRAKSKGEHITVDWVAVGRRIRETRGFDMTQGGSPDALASVRTIFSIMERGKVEIGEEILLRISGEFAKSVEWLLMGKG